MIRKVFWFTHYTFLSEFLLFSSVSTKSHVESLSKLRSVNKFMMVAIGCCGNVLWVLESHE